MHYIFQKNMTQHNHFYDNNHKCFLSIKSS